MSSGTTVVVRSGTGGRVRTACDLCRHRRIRCDRVKPACETCYFAGVPCTFTPEPAQHKKSIREQLAESRARVKQLEEALRAERQSPRNAQHSPPTNPPHGPGSTLSLSPGSLPSGWSSQTNLLESRDFDAALAAVQWHLAFCGPGAAPFKQTPSFELTVHARTGSTLNFNDFFSELAHSFKVHYPTHPKKVIVPRWPSHHLIQRSVEYFFENKLYSIFPVLDINNIPVLPDPNGANPAQAADWACLVGLTAFMTRLRGHESAFADADPDAYVQAVLGMLPELVVDNTNPIALQALVILSLYIAPLGQPQLAELLLAIAIRIVFNLGGNRNKVQDETPEEGGRRQHIRAMFWLCYAIDKEMSIRKCEPPLINDADCDLDLPANYVSQVSDSQFFMKPFSDNELLLSSDLRFSFIKSRIYRLLYSDQARALPEARRLQHIRELDLELSNFISNYPVNCQPEGFMNRTVPDTLLHDLSIRGVNIHLEYYFCLAKVHGASRPDIMPTGWCPLPSSVELCHHAARSTLLYLHRVQHLICPEIFWVHAQFMITALVSLFWHLISTNPNMVEFEDDISIIEGTVAIFEDLNKRNGHTNCFPPFYLMEAFIKRLATLARQTQGRPVSQ